MMKVLDSIDKLIIPYKISKLISEVPHDLCASPEAIVMMQYSKFEVVCP